MSLRNEAVRILGLLGVGILGLMGFMAYHEAMTLREAVGWTLAGWLSVREIMSKIENVALGLRSEGQMQGGPELPPARHTVDSPEG